MENSDLSSHGCILGIDTCTPILASTALFDKGILLGVHRSEPGSHHAHTLVPMIQAILTDSGKSFEDIRTIAATIGPGSFTGIRVGLATAQGLCLALQIPVIGMTTFELFYKDHGASQETDYTCVVIDAKRQEVYTQVFDNKTKASIGEPILALPKDVLATLPSSCTLIGNALSQVKSVDFIPDHLIFYEHMQPTDAATLVRIIDQELKTHPLEEHCLSPSSLQPFYLNAPNVHPPRS